MFTGLVREVGRVASVSGVSDGTARLRIESQLAAAIGDSVSIDGCCLTVVDGDRQHARLRRGAGDARPHDPRPAGAGRARQPRAGLRAGEALGGHYVQGHVDGVGRVRTVEPDGDGKRVWFDAPEDVLRYCVEKGSVTVDGVSLTIAGLDEEGFAVALVPHTLAVTTLGSLEPGSEVNLEADVLAKYVERLTGLRSEHGDDG